MVAGSMRGRAKLFQSLHFILIDSYPNLKLDCIQFIFIILTGYLADPSSDDDYKESELAQNPQRTEGGSHTRGKILHKQTSRQEVNTHTTLKKSSRIAVQQTKNAQRGRQSGACEGSASTGKYCLNYGDFTKMNNL